jgi:hypothetical protein
MSGFSPVINLLVTDDRCCDNDRTACGLIWVDPGSGVIEEGRAGAGIEETFRKRRNIAKKKSKAPALLQQLCRPYFPEILDLILIGGATLLVRARAPPETWTTRLEPYDQPEPILVDYLFRLVIIFSNDCPKFEQSAK